MNSIFERLIVLVPTRGRPAAAVELSQVFAETKGLQSTELIFGCDEDDPTLPEYEKLVPDLILVGPRLRMAGTLNAMSQNPLVQSSTIVGFMGDDHRPRTHGWDQTLLQQAQPLGVQYGDDLIHGPGLPTAVFMDTQIPRTLGGMTPPGMIHLFLDDFWLRLGQELGTLQYHPDLIFEHLHPIAGKAEWDAGYIEANADAVGAADKAAFEAYCASQLAIDVEKLRATL